MADYIILQTVAPDYRKKLYENIKEQLPLPFKVYAGLVYFEQTVQTDTTIKNWNKIHNWFLFQRSFLIQFGMWSDVLNCKVLVVEMNPRIISNWVILVLRKLFGKKTILWGHAWPRAGMDSRTNSIRSVMRKLGDAVIVYTKSQMQELKAKESHLIVEYAPNALYYDHEMRASAQQDAKGINNLIYVGRLTKAKKPLTLLKGFHMALAYLVNGEMLYFVGDGEEREALERYIREHALGNRVILTGHIADYSRLEELYATSLFSVSPGYIGLSVTQSFGFGVPMLVSRNENHSPELEAVEEGFNAVFFETDDLAHLKQSILDIFAKKGEWVTKRTDICERCRKNYSINAMAKAFVKVFNKY